MAVSTGAEVGASVRAELARRGFNQQWLGARLGISQSNVSKRLRGDVAFDVDELSLVAESFGISMRDLIPEQVEAAA